MIHVYRIFPYKPIILGTPMAMVNPWSTSARRSWRMAKMAVGITTPLKTAPALKDGGHGGAARGFNGHGVPP